SAQNAVAKAEETLRLAQVKLVDMTPDPQEVEAAQRDLELSQLQADKSSLAARNAVARAGETLLGAEALLADMLAGGDPDEIAARELQVSQARLTLEEAEADLEAALLVATFSGIVGEVSAEAGDRVAAGAPVVLLVDPSLVEVSATVDEVDVARVRVGQPAIITLDALPGETLRGQVKSVSPVAQVQSGVVSYPVVISVVSGGEVAREGRTREGGQPRRPTGAPGGPSRTGRAAGIQPRGGMSASAEIVVELSRDVLLVPSRAVRFMTPGQMVSVKTDQGVQLVLVEVGLSDGRNTEITSGLNEGDTVVLPASSAITPSPAGRGFGGGRLFR
ncbi:MAG: HlyD family efflux transporter periplasmic adaptor subunit, partial [Dehalococcoidia bacterium]